MGRISPGPTRWPPGAERRLVPAKSNLKPQTFQSFLQAYLATRMYAVKNDVGTTPWVHPTSGVPQGGAEGPFVFLLVTLLLAFYIRRTYPDVAPYPLRTTLLAFADDMAPVTALVVCARRSRPVRGVRGRCRVLCLPRFPLPAPRFPRCVWRAVLSGCLLS